MSKDSYDYFEASDLVVFPGCHSVMWEQVTGQGKPMLVKIGQELITLKSEGMYDSLRRIALRRFKVR